MFNNPYQAYQPMPQQFSPFNSSYEAQFMEVDGKNSIANLQMPPNQRRVYFDKRVDRFYTVETDAIGSKSVAEFDFSPVKEEQPAQYVTVQDFNEWRCEIEQLISRQAENQHGPAKQGTGSGARIPAGSHVAPSNQ